MRVLYIHATLVPPPADQKKDRFLRLSEKLEGDILQPVWFRTPDEIEAIFGPGSYPVYTVGRFRYHWLLADKVSRFATFRFCLKTGFQICRERRTDCIVAYSHMTTALCGVLLKIATGARLIPEVMIAPERTYLTDRPNPTLADRLWHVYSNVCLHLTTWLSDRVHLLYPAQLAHYPLLRHKRNSVFHDYTPISGIQLQTCSDGEDQYVLLAGFPWYRKGVDLAIEGFRRLAADFPRAKLKIVGHFPDGAPQRQAADCPQIEVMNSVPHDQMMRLVSGASIMLLPSRNEGLPRVLIEGMAAGLPLIASDVGGNSFIVRNGENGLVFPDGDVPAMERCLRTLLADPELRRRMGRRSREIAAATLTDEVYAEQFTRMVDATCNG